MAQRRSPWLTALINPLNLAMLALAVAAGLCAAWWLLPGLWAVLYMIALPYTGCVALLYGDRAAATWRRLRTFMFFLGNRGRQDELAREGRGIIADIRALSERESG